MTVIVGDNSSKFRVLAIEEAFCSDILTDALSSNGYQFVTFDGTLRPAELEIANNVDTIVASASFPFDLLLTTIPQEKRDNLLLLAVPGSDNLQIDDALLNRVDGILPSDPSLMIKQLLQILSLHRKNHDLASQVQALESMIATQKRKSTEIDLLKNAIVRNVSHELRTPLLQVKSAVALIVEDPSDKKLLNYAQNAVARLETHIKNITMLGHSLDINITPIILRDTIEYAKRNLTRIWTRRTDADRIRINLEDDLPPILADKQGMSTVLQLLMDNALKFGKESDIEVIGRKANDKVYIAVRDSGIGIAEDQLQTIFESFYQVDDTSTRPYGGAGVGLALVKLILDNHQVNIYVDSELNKGSTFWFEIPYINFHDLS